MLNPQRLVDIFSDNTQFYMFRLSINSKGFANELKKTDSQHHERYIFNYKLILKENSIKCSSVLHESKL